jgi:hypothetical protein
VLAVVQHEQCGVGPEPGRDDRRRVGSRHHDGAQHVLDGAQQLARCDRLQIEPVDGPGGVGGTSPDGQPGLADPTRPDERDQPATSQLGRDRGDLLGAPDERRELRR